MPDNGVYSDQAVHRFQLRLISSELSQARADRANASGNLVKAREVVRRGIDEKWWPSVIFYLNRQARCSVNNLINRHKRKLEKLSERQDRSLKNLDERAVRILDEVVLPLWVREFLSFGPKHPVRDKFNEIHFLADIDSFLSELKLNRIPREKLCEIEAAAKRYARNVKQTPSDKGVEKARKYLKDNGLLAVPFDKGVGFCVMKKETYEKKLKDLLKGEQFSERKNLTVSVIMKIEKDINKELLAMKNKDEISEAMYNRLRSTGAQPARLY